MTRDEIMLMVREANGFEYTSSYGGYAKDETVFMFSIDQIERFAKLAAEKEREACAQIAEDWDKTHPTTNYGKCIAVDIRARWRE